jgi:hypothetical protein
MCVFSNAWAAPSDGDTPRSLGYSTLGPSLSESLCCPSSCSAPLLSPWEGGYTPHHLPHLFPNRGRSVKVSRQPIRALDAAEPWRLQLPEVSGLQLSCLIWTVISDKSAGQWLQKLHPVSNSETNHGVVGRMFPILGHPLREKNGIERKNVSTQLSI